MTIRPATEEDLPALKTLVAAIGLFEADELDELDGMMQAYLAGDDAAEDQWIVDDEDGLNGVAYYAPERMTQGTWNLYLVAVDPARRGQGRGRTLIGHVEQALRSDGHRILIVETSGEDGLAATRAFYDRCGYAEEARIRDFYKAGDDKVVFWKALQA